MSVGQEREREREKMTLCCCLALFGRQGEFRRFPNFLALFSKFKFLFRSLKRRRFGMVFGGGDDGVSV